MNNTQILKKTLTTTAIILIILFAVLSFYSCENGEKIEWAELKLSEMLPQLKSVKGKIYSNTTDDLTLYIYKTSEKDYEDYVSSCINMGFDVEAEQSSSAFIGYKAFNNKGYKLEISWYDKELKIELEAPIKAEKIEWPARGLAQMLPIPKSSEGKISYDRTDSFYATICNITPDEFKQYIDVCAKCGFDVDYDRSDKYYSASNIDGYKLRLNYKGFNTITIDVDAPKPEENTDINPPSTSKPTTDTVKNPESKPTIGILRSDFKEAMDSYEKFIDEYVAFVKKYSANPNDSDLISDYAEYMRRYADMMTKFEKWESEDMNAAETAYYIEVQTRVSKKLLEISKDNQ